VVPGSRVLDIGADVGDFAREAKAAGASVYAIDPDPANVVRLKAIGGVRSADTPTSTWPVVARWGAVGGRKRRGRLDKGPPSIVVDGDDFDVWPLDDVLEGWAPIDVAKMDIEGDEYETLLASRLEWMRVLTVETHVWTEPGQPRRDGVGVQPRPFNPDWPERTVLHLASVFESVEVFGSLDSGATILARRAGAL
jgi:FkbM family methyltransferase